MPLGSKKGVRLTETDDVRQDGWKAYRDGWYGRLDPEMVDNQAYRDGYRRGKIAFEASQENISFNELWRKCTAPMVKKRKKSDGKKSTTTTKIRTDHLDDLELLAEDMFKTVKDKIYPSAIEKPLLDDLASFLYNIDEARLHIEEQNEKNRLNREKNKGVTTVKKGKSTGKVVDLSAGKKSGPSGSRPAGTPALESGDKKPKQGATLIPINKGKEVK